MILPALLLMQTLSGLQQPAAGGLAAPEPSQGPGEDFEVYYRGGIRFEAADGSFKAKMGGRIQWDTAYIGNNRAIEAAVGAPLDDGTEFRRTRLYISGSIHDEVEFKAQYDFAGGAAAFKDVYIAFPAFPAGKLTVGQFKEPFSLEELTSSNSITFMERGLPNAFSPSRSTGVMLADDLDGRFTWAAGVFRDSNDQGMQVSDSELSATARVTGLVYSENDGQDLLHLGAAVSRRSPNGDAAQWRERPENHLSPRFVDTGVFASDESTLVGLEAAWVAGPVSVQGEYIQAQNQLVAGGDATFSGFYVEGSLFLSDGDSRRYDAEAGAFKGPEPAGDDAWEAKLRYSSLDLTDGAIAGGELTDVTVGLNWYMNPNTRLMFEVVNADLDGVDSTLIAQLRCQVTW